MNDQKQTDDGAKHQPFIEIDGRIFNRDHIVIVDVRRTAEHAVTLQTTIGPFEFDGMVADQIAAFFLPVPKQPTVVPAKGRKAA